VQRKQKHNKKNAGELIESEQRAIKVIEKECTNKEKKEIKKNAARRRLCCCVCKIRHEKTQKYHAKLVIVISIFM
jgi:hypothetical protein